MTAPIRVEMFNARRLEREHFETSDWGRRLLRELDIVVANSVFHEMRSKTSLYNDTLMTRVSDFVMPLDEGYQAQSLGIVEIDDVLGADAQGVARKLASLPRGAMAIFKTMRTGGHDGIRAGIGYDGWMSSGDGRLARNSGHAFLSATPRRPELEPRYLYGSVLSMIVYRQRDIAQNAIAQATGEAAKFTIGKKIKGSFNLVGKTWTSLVAEKFHEGYYSGGGNAWQVRVSKRGSAKSVIMGAAGLAALLSEPPVMPPQWQDDRFTDECLSLHEKRIMTAKEFWSHQAPVAGISYEKNQYGDWHASGDVLEQKVLHMPGTDAGCFRVFFEPGSTMIAGSELTDRWAMPEAA